MFQVEANISMTKKSTAWWLVGVVGLLIAAVVLLGLGLMGYTEAAAAPGKPPGPPKRPTPLPTALLGIRNRDTAISPTPLKSGIEMTYTFQLSVDTGSMDARNVVLNLPFVGNQKYLGFEATNPGWKVREGLTDRVLVDLNTLKAGDVGTITIRATFATNYDKTIFRQTVYLRWDDDFQSREVGVNLTAPVEEPPVAKPSPIPDPTLPPTIGPSGPFAGVADPGKPNSDSGWYFPATRHNLHGDFLAYWLSHGALTVLGFPLSEEFQDGGRTVQFFERAVMEFWPENPSSYRVLLRSLGREVGQLEAGVPSTGPAPLPGSVYYPETGHWLDGQFVETWQDRGGLAQFGFPIGEPVEIDGKLIQWTERARFELDLTHPDQIVLLGLVGTEAAQRRGQLP